VIASRDLYLRGVLDPKLDVVFKLLLARPDNATLLRSMIEAVVDLPSPIASVTVLNPEIPRDLASLKSVVLDVCVRCEDGTLIDIEMETRPRADIAPRLLLYWARLYSGQLVRGESYSKLRRAISIVWLNGIIPGLGPGFHSTYHVAEDTTRGLLTNHLEMHLLWLPRLDSSEILTPRLDRWARFFLATDVESLHALALEDPIMSKAVNELERISGDSAARRLLEDIETGRQLHGHYLAVAKEEGEREGMAKGIEQGIEQGLARGLETVARRMIARGVPIEQIAELTGLSPDIIREL